jgi:S1-C subfamily serine protease
MIKMCFRVLLCFALGLIYTTCVCQEIPRAEAVPFIGMEQLSQEIQKAVCAVQMPGNQANNNEKDDWISLGTGFLVLGEQNTVLAVTCKHVVEVAQRNKKEAFIGLDTEEGYRRFPCRIGFIDPDKDIAIILPQANKEEDIKLKNKVFGKNLFDDDSSLIEGRGVLIPGYPLALGVEDDQNHPVVRFGIIAQFTGNDYFLLDSIASHGNSGSPVFAIKSGENRLVGMVTSHVSDTINLFTENGSLSARLPYNSGLARCITMKTIISAIQHIDYQTIK